MASIYLIKFFLTVYFYKKNTLTNLMCPPHLFPLLERAALCVCPAIEIELQSVLMSGSACELRGHVEKVFTAVQ